jgi:hypothetical protein
VTASDAVEIALGAVLIAATLYDLFQSVVLPRPAVGRVRFSPTLTRLAWRAWRAVATRPRRLQEREGALAVFGPLAVMVLLVFWGFLLIVGYALLYDGLGEQLHPQPGTFGTAVYYSAGRMLAFPVDGIEATGTAARTLATLEAASGFGLFALVISLLFSLFSSFQRREIAVVALDALAGAPPSGVQLLETCAKDDMPQELAATFNEWRMWTVDVLESHLSYPLLVYFRSSHDNEAWPNSFGAVMDAAALVLTTVEGGPVGQARLMYKVGAHLIADMGQYYRFEREQFPGVEHDEFVEAYGRLRAAGYRLRDPDAAWEAFTGLRTVYAPWLNRLARALALPPAPWIGDRSYIPHRERRRKSPTPPRPE